MSTSIRIKKGANIKLVGEAEKVLDKPRPSDVFAIKPPDFHGLTPKLDVKEGDEVKAGSPLFHDKQNDRIKFCSPVSGEVTEVVRGAKRRIMAITVLPDKENNYIDFGKTDPKSVDRKELIEKLLDGGIWPFIRQRPFSIIADPEETPRAIFISGFDSSPLAPDPDFVLQGNEELFQTGLDALNKLADGNPVHLNIKKGSTALKEMKGVTINSVSGPHPAGNVGVQIHHIMPLNKGDVMWYLDPQDVVNIGRFMATGNADLRKVVALTGSEMKDRKYVELRVGSNLKPVLEGNITEGNNRIISGNVLHGDKVETDGFLGFYHHQLTAIPEGDEPQFFLTEGWLAPGFNKFSLSRAFPSWLMPGKKYKLNTNKNGEERAYVMTGQYEKVFPFDIYPVQLVKSIIVNDIEAMENLGIYEVAPEDFALCEYSCTSKIQVQKIVREGLDTIMEEFK